MNEEIKQVILTGVQKTKFKDKASGTDMTMTSMSFMTVVGNEPYTFWVNDIEFAAKYAHLKVYNFLTDKIKESTIGIRVQLKKQMGNNYKLQLLGLQEKPF